MQQTMREMELDVASAEKCASTIGLPLKECFKHIYNHLSDNFCDSCANRYSKIFETNKHLLSPSLFPEVYTTLDELKEHDIALAIASSRSHDSLIELLEMMRIETYFSLVIGVDNIENAKPHPEAVLKIMQTLKYTPNNTIVVGDMPVDIEMGKRAHTKTCGVTYGNATRSQLQQAGANYLIDKFSCLINILNL